VVLDLQLDHPNQQHPILAWKGSMALGNVDLLVLLVVLGSQPV